MSSNHDHHSPKHAATSIHDDLVECPVMPGSMISRAEAHAEGWYRDHEGKRYWLCCAACGPMWDDDPAMYAIP